MNRQKGFTLIELLLVLAIIGIISAIAIPALLGQRVSARNRATESQAANVAAAIQVALDICEKPANERPVLDLAALPDNTNATTVVNTVLARSEYLTMHNPFTNVANPYTLTTTPTLGNVGLNITTNNGVTVINLFWAIQTNGAVAVRQMPKSPETSLPVT